MASRAHRDQPRVTGDAVRVTGPARSVAAAAQRRPDPSPATDRDVTGDAPHRRDAAADRSSVIVLDPRSLRAQRSGRYVAGTAAHPTRLGPDLAATLINAYSDPGDLILDPLAATGTVLVEALHLGRNALGIADDAGWVALSRANIALARRQGATGHARVFARDATRLPAGIPAELHGQVALTLTAPPPTLTMRSGAPQGTRCRIGMVDAMAAVLAGCVPLMGPGGVIAVVARPWYRDGALIDLPGQVLNAGHLAGLTVVDCRRLVHLHHRGTDQPRRQALPPSSRPHHPAARTAVAHHDVTVFATNIHPSRR